MARDTARRRRKLDNRMEWLITQALNTGVIAYNDGKIKFSVDYGRPSGQEAQTPTSGTYASTTHDPINDIIKMQQTMYDLYGVKMTRAICSRKFLNSLINSTLFAARTGLVVAAGGTSIDPRYLLDGWGPKAVQAVVEAATELTFIEYDSVYRTRSIGATAVTNTRFLPENKVIFLPDEADINEFDDTGIGFGKTLTSPHPMGGWTAGYYAWERETTDPWGTDQGSGIKAFPVFPHMDLSFSWTVTLPS